MYSRILVPLDGSTLAECVLPHVDAIAKGCGTETVAFVRAVEPIHLAMTADPSAGYTFSARDWQRMEDEQKKAAWNYLNALAEKTRYDNVRIQTEVINGKAAESIASYAENHKFDLILIATHGRSGISRWIWGSVADKILRSACVPVLMVRAPGCSPREIEERLEEAAAVGAR